MARDMAPLFKEANLGNGEQSTTFTFKAAAG